MYVYYYNYVFQVFLIFVDFTLDNIKIFPRYKLVQM